jgi:hypothetical protein
MAEDVDPRIAQTGKVALAAASVRSMNSDAAGSGAMSSLA